MDAPPKNPTATAIDPLIEATMFVRDRRFFTFFTSFPGSDGAKVLALAAFAQTQRKTDDLKAVFTILPDSAALLKDSTKWYATLRSISSKGRTFALFDKSDDAYGRSTGVPRRELGILGYSFSDMQQEMQDGSKPMQLVMPQVSNEGVSDDFTPTSPRESMAAAFQKNELDHLQVGVIDPNLFTPN